jgi:hypothetical protein
MRVGEAAPVNHPRSGASGGQRDQLVKVVRGFDIATPGAKPGIMSDNRRAKSLKLLQLLIFTLMDMSGSYQQDHAISSHKSRI